MRVEVDAASGVVRLDEEGFDALVRAAERPEGAEPEIAARLPEVLAVPGMPEALAAARHPEVEVRLDLAGRHGAQSHWMWLDLDAAAVLLQVRDRELQLVATAPQYFAAAVARVTRLGPRRVGPREPLALGSDVVEDLFHTDQMRRTSALTLAGADLAWTLSVRWDGGERQLAVVDGENGLFEVEPLGQEWQLRPVTGTELWRLLTTALPADEEWRGAATG